MRKGEGGTHEVSGFQGSELREFRCPNININKLLKCEKKERWDPHFGISGFETS
jgi:hypothetical protein